MATVINRSALETILGHERLAFCCAELESINLQREGSGDYDGPTLEACIQIVRHATEHDREEDRASDQVTTVKFRFHAVVELKLEEFGIQNFMENFCLLDVADRQLEDVDFEVFLGASAGGSLGSFQCKAVAVLSVGALCPKAIAEP